MKLKKHEHKHKQGSQAEFESNTICAMNIETYQA